MFGTREKSRHRGKPVKCYLFRGVEPSLENLTRSVTIIPGTTEFGYGTTLVESADKLKKLNRMSTQPNSDFVHSVEDLLVSAPNLKHVSLVVAWHGDDLRINTCKIKPKIEFRDMVTVPYEWRVGPVVRETADLVSYIDGKPALGGAPSDRTVFEAVRFLKSKGLKVTLYPFIMMDVPSTNALPNPYGGTKQPPYPWRGRITCTPAPDQPGTVDATAAAATQVNTFFGTAAAGHFAWNAAAQAVDYSGPAAEWSFRRFILHMATIGAAAGADDFLIGSEMVGMTSIRSNATTFPAVDRLVTLAADCRSILGAGVKISYAADWSEYHSHRAGSNVIFHLDPLWGNSNIDYIGIDNYLPMGDWRDGNTHLDRLAGFVSPYDKDYIQSHIEGGEYYDWFYASAADRAAQRRTPIFDGAHGEAWVWRQKDIRNWRNQLHQNRVDGIRVGHLVNGHRPQASWSVANGGTKTADATPYIGGQYSNASVYTSSTNLAGRLRTTISQDAGRYTFIAYFKRGTSNRVRLHVERSTGAIALRVNLETLAYFGQPAESTVTIEPVGDDVFKLTMTADLAVSTSTAYMGIGADTTTAGQTVTVIGGEALIDGMSATGFQPGSKMIVFTELGLAAVEKSLNQPNVFVDPKSSENAYPYFSNGRPDVAIQRAGLEASLDYWKKNGTGLVDFDKISLWTWDARPYPTFPERGDFYGDAPNWQLGHWLTGRLRPGFGFDAGEFGPYAFCDGEEPITRAGITYQPWPIEITDIASKGDLDKSDITVTMARASGLENEFIGFPPSHVVNLIVFQGHVGDLPSISDFPAIWVGRVGAPTFENTEISFNCIPVSTSIQRPGLRRNYQLSCPHVLFGPACRASRNNATVVRPVVGISGSTIMLGSPLPRPGQKYRGGLVEWTSDGHSSIRTIVNTNADGRFISVRGNLRGLTVGQEVKVTFGCNRLQSDCQQLHRNILNFGGQPLIPVENPLSQKNIFY